MRELAPILGVTDQKRPRGQFRHPNVITFLDSEGEMMHQQIGIRSHAQPIVAALERATRAMQ